MDEYAGVTNDTRPSAIGMSLTLAALSDTDGQWVQSFCAANRQQFVTHTHVSVIGQSSAKHSTRLVLLTSHTLYEFPNTTSFADNATPSKTKSLSDIHSIEFDRVHPTRIRLYFFSGALANRAAMSFTKLKRALNSQSSWPDFLKSRAYDFATPLERQQWQLVLTALLRNCYQSLCEAELVPSPEVYQKHAFVLKGAKDRLVVLSTHWLYNVECSHHPTVVKAVKWAMPIEAISSVSMTDVNHGSVHTSIELILRIDRELAASFVDSKHPAKVGDTDKDWHFVFRSVDERESFFRSIYKTYYARTGRQMNNQQQ